MAQLRQERDGDRRGDLAAYERAELLRLRRQVGAAGSWGGAQRMATASRAAGRGCRRR